MAGGAVESQVGQHFAHHARELEAMPAETTGVKDLGIGRVGLPTIIPLGTARLDGVLELNGSSEPLDGSGGHPCRRNRWIAHHSRRRNWSGAHDALGPAEEAEDEAILRSSGAGNQQAWPAFAPQCLADLLVRRPGLPPGARDCQTHPYQSLRGPEIGDLKPRVDCPRPQVPRHLLVWRDARLGEVPIPFGPHRGLVTGEVERLDDRAALPAAVWRRKAPRQRIGAVDGVPPPSTLPKGDRVDVEGHAQAAPGSSRLETRRATRA